MRSWNYVHADQVLPARLVKEIRQYATGLLYIPTDIAQTRQRTALRVRALKEQGFRNCEIARILGITPRHVCGVLRRFQEATGITTHTGEITGDAPQGGHSDGGETPPSPRV
ncbi:MAG: helix-turn-helix domain-containing protein [Armatimonadota bacterium]